MSTRDRIKNFLAPQSEYEQTLLKLYSENGQMGGPGVDRGSVFAQKNNILREIPVMVTDPIIASSLALIMETAFQPTDDSELFRVSSDHPAVVEELEAFHRDMNMDESLLTIAYNILIYGNLPIRHHYSKEYQYERFEFVPDFRRVVPIVLANRVLGYNVDGEFAFPYEYTYGQHLYFKDLGGPASSSRQRNAIRRNDGEQKIENGFILAPSYLSPAVRPWRSIKIVEDALLLQRMDLSTYMRIIGVKVGDNVFTKNAIRLLNFYRQVFKKVRRVSYDGDGMSSTSFGNEYEVVLPITDSQSLDVKDIGGQVDIRALRDLDILYKKMFSALRIQPSMIGFSEDVPSSLGESGAVQRWDERFGRLVKAIRLSTVKVMKEIDTFFLRSRGYDVSERDFHYTFVATSTVEDEERRASFTENVKALTETIAALESSKVQFNRNYLVKEYFAKAFSATAIDTEKLFGQEPVMKIVSSGESFIDVDDKTIALYGAVKLLNEEQLAVIRSDRSGSHSDRKIQGMPLQPILSYRRFLSLGDSISSGYEVDLSEEVQVIADMESRKANFSSTPNVPVPPLARVFSDTSKLSADMLASGRIAEIEDLYLVDGGYYLVGKDLINYLFMLDRGLNSIPAKRVWKED